MTSEIDPQVQTLLEEWGEEEYPDGHSLSVLSYREEFRERMATQSSEKVDTVRNFSIPGPESDIPLRIYIPSDNRPLPVIVFFHGGGWVLGDLDCYDNLCTYLANRAESIVISVDYRLAPENLFPAAPEDCYAATEWVVSNVEDIGGDPQRVAVSGTSAGGNLAIVVSLMSRDWGGPNIARQVPIYPGICPISLRTFDSHEKYATGYNLTTESIYWFYDQYLSDPIDAQNAYAFPLQARDLSGLPPATIVSAEYDPLRDESFEYERRLSDAGVTTDHLHFETMIHDFLSLTDHIDGAEAGIEALGNKLQNVL